MTIPNTKSTILKCFTIKSNAKKTLFRTLSLLSVCFASVSVVAQTDGENIFNASCASCHVQLATADGKIPNRDAMGRMTANAVLRSLTDGAMRLQGNTLSAEQRVAVSESLTDDQVVDLPVTFAQGMCESLPAVEKPSANTIWAGWSPDPQNTRHVKDTGGINADNLSSLKLKWAFGVPNVTSVRSQPAIWGDRLFVGSQGGVLFALNAQTGCTYWSFKTQGGVRNAITVAEVAVDGVARPLVLFTDLQAFAYAVDAETGQLSWQKKVDDHQGAMGTGALKYHDGKIYVPIAGLTEEALANGKNDYQCCSFRGSVTALDAATGKELWKTYTVPEAKYVRTLESGKELWGPAGVAVWSTPTIDSKRGLLYIGTGNAYVEPPVGTSNAIMALELKTGKVAWTTQVLENDIWSGGCEPSLGGNSGNPGCFDPVGPDFDFSASPALVTMDNGKDMLVATQKSGLAYGLDPDKKGKMIWQYRWGVGAAPGAVYGTATDGTLAYFAVADQRTEKPGGLHAVEIKTGKRAWFTPPPATLCSAGPGCGKSQHAAVTSIPGVALSSSVDGGLRAYSAKTGEIIWTYNANQPYETVNGVKANGGSIDVSSAVIVNGMLYISAGNGGPFGTPGNVILAFALEQ